MAIFLGSKNFNGYNGSHFSLHVYVDSYSQDIANNSTTTIFHLYLVSSDGYSGSGVATPGYINNNQVGSISSIGRNATVSVGTFTQTVSHAVDGTLNWYWAVSMSFVWAGIGSCSLDGWWTVPTIPRSSSVSCTDGNIESAVSININRASASFLHNLRYVFGNLSGTIATNIATNYGWTLPATFYSQIPNSKSGTCVIYCDTYNNGNLIGTSSAVFNVGTDENKCLPTFNTTIIDSNSMSTNLTGDPNKLIKYISNAHITTSATAKNNASIKSINITCGDGKTAIGSDITLKKVESGDFTVTVIDSRGYIKAQTLNKKIINYIVLTLNATFVRVEPTTGEVLLKYDGNYFDGNFGKTNNNLTIKYRYRENTNYKWSDYITLSPVIKENTYSQEISLGKDFDYQKAYNFEIQAIDKIVTVVDDAEKITEGIPMLALFKEMIEMFGIEAFKILNNKLVINGEIQIENVNIALKDVINNVCFIEETEDGKWMYKKYENGLIEIYHRVTDISLNTTIFYQDPTGPGIFYQQSGNINYPIELTELISINSTVLCESHLPYITIKEATNTYYQIFISNIKRVDGDFNFSYFTRIVGRWK